MFEHLGKFACILIHLHIFIGTNRVAGERTLPRVRESWPGACPGGGGDGDPGPPSGRLPRGVLPPPKL